MAQMWQGQPPKPAVLLGAFGLFPFLALGAISVFGPVHAIENALGALAAYGAIILSFLGGAHWGFCIAGSKSCSPETTFRLMASVTPSIVAWLSLLGPTEISLYVLSCAFVAMLIFDIWSARHGWAPAWYPVLRWPLSIGAVISSLAAVAV